MDNIALIENIFSHGQIRELSGNSPHVTEKDVLVAVVAGEVDLFFKKERGDLLSAGSFSEEEIFAVPSGMQLSGKIGTVIKELELVACEFTREEAEYVLAQVTTFTDMLIRDFITDIAEGKVYNGGDISLEEEMILRGGTQAHLVALVGGGEYNGSLALTGDNFVILSRNSWLRSSGALKVRNAVADSQALVIALQVMCEFISSLLEGYSRRMHREWTENVRKSQKNSADAFDSTLRDLASVMDRDHLQNRSGADKLAEACALVARACGKEITVEGNLHFDSVESFAARYNIRTRRLRLDEEWYKADCGAVVGWIAGKPAAFIPESAGYRYIIPGEKSGILGSDIAREIAAEGWSLFPDFPGRKVRRRDILKLSWLGGAGDLKWILFMGILTGLLGMVTPSVTGLIISHVIPSGNYSMLFDLGLALLTATVAAALFDLVQNFSLLRFSARSSSFLQAAMWDRLLSLPASFFGRYQDGDLVDRALGIITIKDILSRHLVSSSLAITVGLFNFFVAFYYSWQLTIIVIVFTLIGSLVNVFFSLHQLRFQRRMQKANGEFQGFLLQIITAIAKIRVSGAEVRAFSRLSRIFIRQNKYSYDYSIFARLSSILFSMLPLMQTGVTFYFIVKMKPDERLSVGSYMAFTAAAAQISRALSAVSSLGLAVIQALPHYERVRPILEEKTEQQDDTVLSPKLKGEIELRNVNFSYDGETNIINDVSLKAAPGEFVAVVGASGAGKSTLLKLLLGLERPKSGIVLFDEVDMATYNIKSLRRQFGVVLQGGGIMQGSIFSNICGAANLSQDEAWEALRLAGLQEEIKAMPMNIHTVLPQGGGVLSGGQQQRLMIARALASRPRILFFDEATSALDNRLQHEVSENIEGLNLTRVVIAHRLSTIRNADRIYVMDKGRIVQEGSYEELLLQKDSIFAELCKRQES